MSSRAIPLATDATNILTVDLFVFFCRLKLWLLTWKNLVNLESSLKAWPA